METGYKVKESKHTSLLEDGFMPVETAPEVTIQEQYTGKWKEVKYSKLGGKKWLYYF